MKKKIIIFLAAFVLVGIGSVGLGQAFADNEKMLGIASYMVSAVGFIMCGKWSEKCKSLGI